MADYPTLMQRVDSGREDIDTVYTSVSPANQFDSLSYQGGAVRRRFLLRHVLDAADRATLRAFYAANKYGVFNFDSRDAGERGTFEVGFVAAPEETQIASGYWLFEVVLETWRALQIPTDFLLLRPSGDYILTRPHGDRIGVRNG